MSNSSTIEVVDVICPVCTDCGFTEAIDGKTFKLRCYCGVTVYINLLTPDYVLIEYSMPLKKRIPIDNIRHLYA